MRDPAGRLPWPRYQRDLCRYLEVVIVCAWEYRKRCSRIWKMWNALRIMEIYNHAAKRDFLNVKSALIYYVNKLHTSSKLAKCDIFNVMTSFRRNSSQCVLLLWVFRSILALIPTPIQERVPLYQCVCAGLMISDQCDSWGTQKRIKYLGLLIVGRISDLQGLWGHIHMMNLLKLCSYYNISTVRIDFPDIVEL